MRTRTALLATALAAVVAAPVRAADDDPLTLLKYIPPMANAVVVVNVQSILNCPRAVKEGWAKLDHPEYLAGAIPVHPAVERFVLAKHLDPHAPGAGQSVAVLPVNKPIDMPKLAALVGGQETNVGDDPAVTAPNGGLMLAIEPKLLGVARVENRQDAARWVRYARSATASPLGKYLNRAIYQFATRHQIAVAVDAEDLVEPARAKAAVAASEALAGRSEVDQVTAFVGGMRGVLFLADVKENGLAAQLRLAGGKTIGLKPGVMKKFVIEQLGRAGASFDNLPGATETIEDGVVSLSFAVSDAELARVMGLFLPPIPPGAGMYTLPVAPAAASADATQRYFRAVTRVLDDVRGKEKKATDYDKTALWHDSAANTIESLSVTGVEKSVAEFGAGTAARLRAIADSLRGVPVQAAALEAQTYAIGYVPRVWRNPWFGAGVSVDTNLPEMRRKEAEAVRQDAANRAKLWAAIDDQRARVRSTVGDK